MAWRLSEAPNQVIGRVDFSIGFEAVKFQIATGVSYLTACIRLEIPDVYVVDDGAGKVSAGIS